MKTIDAATLKKMYISGANNLFNHYPEVDQLNVFPVPDGDTGMNMNLTATSGSKEIQNREFDNVGDLASAFSKGLLMGARGNSGVISSQIFRGFAECLKGKKKIGVLELSEAFTKAKEVAYKAVMKPVEGTILTVIRESSAALSEYVRPNLSIEDAMDYLLEQARVSLEHTPELLPVLKEVGVVDSGGAGLVYIIEGMTKAVHGTVVERKELSEPIENNASPYAGAKLSEDEEGYGYCTQFIVRLGKKEDGKKPFKESVFKKYLLDHGKSVVLVQDDDIVKVHVHTLTPGNMLNYAQQFGEFVTIVIENMSEEHKNIEHGMIAYDANNSLKREGNVSEEKEEDDTPLQEFGLVAVSSGDGLDELFKELGVNVLVSGGQTMNPSTEDFVKAIKKAHAKNVFLLPNNSNIVLAATQACDVYEDGEVKAKVIPSKTIPQGLTAAMRINPDGTPEEIFEDMKGALKDVRSGSVTYAIKDTDIEGVHVTKDYYMAMEDKKIVSCVKDKIAALLDLLEHLIKEDTSSLMLLLGKDVTEEEEGKINEAVSEKYGDRVEATIYRGDQPVYSFLVGVE